VKKIHVLFLTLVIVASVVFPSISRADGVTLTLDTTNLTVIEGHELTATFTLSNDTAADIAVGTWIGGVGQRLTFVGGDPSDSFISAFSRDECSFSTLAAGKSCKLFIIYVTESGKGETDGNFGVSHSGVCFTIVGGAAACSTPYDMTVQDPVATPEPSSLFLLGVGLMGTLGRVRRQVFDYFHH